jgi:hypothetical protein
MVDHITSLPMSNGFNELMVVVDRFTKMAHFIPSHSEDDAVATARRYLDGVVKHHGLPKTIVSDRGTKFTSVWWREMLRMMDTVPNYSTAFHPESDGQTERTNQTIELYLQLYCGFQQDDWQSLLAMAEFAYNNSYHSSTGMSPFYCNSGWHPRMAIMVWDSNVPDVRAYAAKLEEVHVKAREMLRRARESARKFADRKRIDVPEEGFRVGDLVLLDRRNIKTMRPAKKLDDKYLGPFRIEKWSASPAWHGG